MVCNTFLGRSDDVVTIFSAFLFQKPEYSGNCSLRSSRRNGFDISPNDLPSWNLYCRNLHSSIDRQAVSALMVFVRGKMCRHLHCDLRVNFTNCLLELEIPWCCKLSSCIWFVRYCTHKFNSAEIVDRSVRYFRGRELSRKCSRKPRWLRK